MSPFRNIARLALGDGAAKALNALTVLYLARVLGVADFGVLELATAVMTYFLLLADGGLEVWATRQAARGEDLGLLVGRVLPLRGLFAAAAFGLLLLLLPFLPDYAALRPLLVLFGLGLFVQATNLKWVFLGREQLGQVAAGLTLAQAVFALAVVAVVRGPADVIWVPLLRLAGDLGESAYFLYRFSTEQGRKRPAFTLAGTRPMLRPAWTLGATHALGLLTYSFDSVLLGLLLGPAAVGLYSAAYRPVTLILALRMTYLLGLFPALARSYEEGREPFSRLVARSLQVTSGLALPLGVGGGFLAEPIVDFLFGVAYADSAAVLRVLCWSAVLVILRGTYRQALQAAGRPDLDLRCALAAAILNVPLTLLLIPPFGLLGAAAATVAADLLWLVLVQASFSRQVLAMSLLPWLARPAAAAMAMSACFLLVQPLVWPVRALLASAVYFGVLLVRRP